MDKKMNRQILFRPDKTVSQVLEEKANIQVKNINTKKEIQKTESKFEIPKSNLTIQQRSENLYQWLQKHPLINLNGLCKKTGADRGNFIKSWEKGKELKEELLVKFILELKEYGYQ